MTKQEILDTVWEHLKNQETFGYSFEKQMPLHHDGDLKSVIGLYLTPYEAEQCNGLTMAQIREQINLNFTDEEFEFLSKLQEVYTYCSTKRGLFFQHDLEDYDEDVGPKDSIATMKDELKYKINIFYHFGYVAENNNLAWERDWSDEFNY